jgi:hypothetical protein
MLSGTERGSAVGLDTGTRKNVLEQVAELLGDPRYMQGVAYGFRNDTDILPPDL